MFSITNLKETRSIFMGWDESYMSPLRPTGINKLPQELIDRILDNLAHDSVALRSCSFVARSWLKQCRHHLFGLLRVRDTHINTGLRSRPLMKERFQTFLTFIASIASPGFCAKVHTLCLLGNEERHESQTTESYISAHALATLLGQLHRVRILELSRVHFTALAPDPRGLSPLPMGKMHLDVLSIGRVGLEDQSTDGLFSVLGLFSTLGMLRVSYLETPRHAPTEADLHRLERLQVHRFSLKGHSSMMPQPSRTMPYMLSVLLNSNSVHTLQSIEIKCCTLDQIAAFGSLVNVTGAHLKSVAVDISDIVKGSNADSQGVIEMLGIRSCTGLQHLRVQIFPNEEDAASHLWIRASHFLAAVLANISPLVLSVTIVLQYHDVLLKNCSMADWESLRQVGGGVGWRRFTHLEEVVFALMPRCLEPSIESDAKHHITSQLSELSRRGVLRFTTTGFWEDRETVISLSRKNKCS